MKRKKPESAIANRMPFGLIAIEQAQQEASNYGETVIEQLAAAAKDHSNFSRAVGAIEKAISSQSSTTVHNYGKIVKELPNLKAVFQGNTIQGDVNFSLQSPVGEPAKFKPIKSIPYPSISNFVERDDVLTELHDKLQQENTMPVCALLISRFVLNSALHSEAVKNI